MRIHILQHVWLEDEGVIGVWVKQNVLGVCLGARLPFGPKLPRRSVRRKICSKSG